VRWGHAVAGIAALALLLVTVGMDWYGTLEGDNARELEEQTEDAAGAEAAEVQRNVHERAAEVADRETDKAWEADALIDRIILVLLGATIVLAVVTWFTRSLGGRPTKGLGPAGACALLATLTAVLIAYRIIQEPGLDAATTVKAGPVVALILLAAIAIASSWTLRDDDQQEEETADARAD
jgi:hypothetical protein